MNRLNAISLGYAVPRDDFTAQVHGVFTHAVNLSLLTTGQLITLVTRGEPDLPQGIRLDTPESFTFEGLSTGKKTFCRNGTLSLTDGELLVDLHIAKLWKCNLQALAINIHDPLVNKSWQCAMNLINQEYTGTQNGSLGFQFTIVCKINEISKELITFTQQMDEISFERTIKKLIGLGPGLTPAGDDFLVGFLAGLWSTAGKNARHVHFLRQIRNAVERNSYRTNDISLIYLYHATHGQVSSRLRDLAGVISCGKSNGDLEKAIEASIHVGHISGFMATKGLLEAMMVWNRDKF